MSNQDAHLLAKISKNCFFRFQPQPLVDLLNQRGIVGRPAEVFWTYFHWGFQNGSYSCQLSSAYLAEVLFTDVRTIQRANERLQEAGLIARVRAKRSHGTHLEAPAITSIKIPDDEVRARLDSAPTRSGAAQEDNAPAVKATVSDGSRSEFTAVNKTSRASHQVQYPSPAPSPTPEKRSMSSAASRGGDIAKVKAALPTELQRFHDMCMIKAQPGAFKKAIEELGVVSDSDAEILMQPLVRALDCKRKELSAVQSRSGAKFQDGQVTATATATKARSNTRPEDPRAIPKKVLSFIEERLRARTDCAPREELGRLLKEIVYSITIGTMRGLDLMHAINTTIKLIRTKQWARPIGMPDGWQFDHVLQGAS